MTEPLFYRGQAVVCVESPKHKGKLYGLASELIEGKKYLVSDPAAKLSGGILHIELQGLHHRYNQKFFMPYETDKAMEDEIFEALKEDLKIKI